MAEVGDSRRLLARSGVRCSHSGGRPRFTENAHYCSFLSTLMFEIYYRFLTSENHGWKHPCFGSFLEIPLRTGRNRTSWPHIRHFPRPTLDFLLDR